MGDLVTNFDLLDRAGIEYTPRRHAPFLTMEDVVAAGFDPARSVKTLAFRVGEELVLAGIVGDRSLRYPLLARALGVSRAKLERASEADLAGVRMEPGGVCPLAAGPGVRVVLDAALDELDEVDLAGGAQELSLTLSTAALHAALPHALVTPLTEPR